jgi:hypothetical protein
MHTPFFIGTEQPDVRADLHAIEATYDFVLLVDYKEHILACNGGWPKNENTFLQVGEDDQ